MPKIQLLLSLMSEKVQRKFPFRPLIILWIVLFATVAGWAQVDRAGLNGTVTDPSGQVVPGVHIKAIQESTGLQREAISTADGTYDIPELPVGRYTVTFTHDGFATLIFTNVIQAVGQTRTLDARMSISGVTQRVEVSTSSLEINKTSDSLGSLVEHEQVKNLPLNGRNWATLTALVPAAIDTGGSNQRTIRFAGRGLDDNNFTSDGIDATNIVNQAQQAFVRVAIPTDTIQEFRGESMLFSAESGSTPGGQMAVTTVAGTNEFHGDLFDFVRNAVFDARNFFDVGPTPPFSLNQFGGSVGGPIVHNKTFFYVSYEGIQQDLGQSLLGFVPTAAFREQVLAQSPILGPIIAAYPAGQTQINSQVAEFTGQGDQLDNENSGMIRVDHYFTDKTTAFVRFNTDVAIERVPLASSGQYLNDMQDVSSRPVNGIIEVLHIFSPNLVNEAKFGFNRGTVVTGNLGQNQLPYSISVPEFTTQNNNEVRISVGNSFSEVDNLTWVKGKHVLKFGVEVRRIQLNQGNTANGTISYASLDDFAANQVNSATFTEPLPVNGLRKTEVYAFAQDEYKLKPNLSLNLGLRYVFYNIFHEVLGRAIPFDFSTCGPGGFCGAGASFSQPNTLDLDPRIGIAWAPGLFRGKTVIRTGFGIYHGDGQLDDQNLPIDNEVGRFSLSSSTIPNLSYPITPFLVDTIGIVSPREADRRRKDMYVMQWGLSVEQSLPHDLVGTVSYVGSKGTHILTTSYVNVIDPETGGRPYPDFGQVEFRGNDNNAEFDALQVNLQRHFSNGLLLSANYMWSHEIDEDSPGGGDSDFPQNVNCRTCDRASGDFDARQTFSVSAAYDLPFGSGKRYLSKPGFAHAVFGSWSLTSIVGGRTGLPVNVTITRPSSDVPDGDTVSQRPDIVPGVPLAPLGGSTVQEWINPAAFVAPASGTFGDAGRNIFRGPGIWQADLGLAKVIPVTERIGLQFRADIFNILNHPNFANPQSNFSSGPGIFGAILTTQNTGPVGTGTPRQIQLALRMTF